MKKYTLIVILLLLLSSCARVGHSRGTVTAVWKAPVSYWVEMSIRPNKSDRPARVSQYKVDENLYNEFAAHIGTTYNFTYEEKVSIYITDAEVYTGD